MYLFAHLYRIGNKEYYVFLCSDFRSSPITQSRTSVAFTRQAFCNKDEFILKTPWRAYGYGGGGDILLSPRRTVLYLAIVGRKST